MSNKKNTICHVTVVHPYNDNRIFYKECISLKEEGYKVLLIAPDVESNIREGIEIHGIKKYKNRIVHFIRTSVLGVFKKAKRLNADIYHFHDPELMIFGILMRIIGKKVIYDIHENNSASILSKPYIKKMWVRRLISWFVKITEIFLVRFYSGLVVARPDIEEKFKKFKPILINNFPIIIEPESVDLNFEKEKDAIIYVGGLSKIRGVIELINAFSEIDDVELWLLGPFESENFRKDCENANGWYKVRYLGTVEPKMVFSYIQKADAGIVTFLNVPNHITTLPTKPFEYMICKKPMIMSNFKYWESVFNNGAYFVNPADSQNIKDSVLNMFSDKDKMEEMGEVNYSRVIDEYNWEIESKKLVNVYVELLNS